MQKILKMWAWALVFLSGICVGNVSAQQPSVGRETMDAAIEQHNGQYPEMDMSYFSSLGMQQKAWNNPSQHLGEGQSKPGYSKYYWKPDLVLPIRIREGMVTLINFPSWELLETVWIGAQEAFSAQFPAPNALLIHANTTGGIVGVDSNMIVFGRSGNRYVFYLRSETYNTDRITNAVVDIIVSDPNYTPDDSGRTPVALGEGGGNSLPSAGRGNGTSRSAGGKKKAKDPAEGWLEDIPVDPEKLRFDIDIFAPNPEDMEITPERVWRDEVFTYIDLGPKALSMLQRPVVNLLVQNSEVPIGFRTRGPNGRLIVVEGIGDLILRNGQRIVCLKIRKDPTFGTEWVEYEESVQKPWNPGPMITTSVNEGGVSESVSVGVPGFSPQGGSFTKNSFGGSAPQRSGSGNRFQKRSSGAPAENIAIELGSDSEIVALERKWDNISRKNQDLLSGYEPYFSVDAVAEGETRDLFRLRIGPVSSIKDGDKLCNQLGRRGVTCMVVRTQ